MIQLFTSSIWNKDISYGQYNRKSTTSINGQLLIIWSWMSKRQRSSPCHFWRPSPRSNHWPTITDLSRWCIPQSYWVFNYLQISNGIHISITCVPRQVSVCSPWECWNVMVRVHPRNLRSVYCYFIRPVLEYACPVWHSSLPSFLSDQVEHIQRRATKVICPSLSNNQRLTELELPTLFDRVVMQVLL